MGLSEIQQKTRLDLTPILDDIVDWRYKGFPPTDKPVTIGTIGEQDWNALSGDLLFPLLLIKERALDHNIALMARYCEEHGVSLAPHGKTPMSTQIVQRQLDAGAWGITAATIGEARVFRAFGVPRILLANELIEPAGISWIVSELERDPDFDFLCLADSLEGVSILEQTLERLRPERKLRILVELGVTGGRAGVRTEDDAVAIARAVHQSPHLELAGVEGYEGAIKGATLEEQIAAVDQFLQRLRGLVQELCRLGLFDGLEEIVVSAGGSNFFDRVVEALAPPWDFSPPVRAVLRSGSYVTHDADAYERLSPLAGRGSAAERLIPALELWGLVLSKPEPDLAILGFGKRDAPYDLRLPVPVLRRRGADTERIEGRSEVTVLNDQHAFLRTDPDLDLTVGDLVRCDVSHPCTSFDKWRLLPLVDDDYRVTGAIQTFF
jgi:D-serine deaminase-like pyridoxal phosphate-dependent protein